MTTSIKLRDIPQVLLPVISTTNWGTLWLNGNTVKQIFIFRDQFRVITNRGDYRYSLDSDMELDIT